MTKKPAAEDVGQDTITASVASDAYPNLSRAQEAALDRIPDDGVTRPGGAPAGGNRSKLEVALDSINDLPAPVSSDAVVANPPPTVGRIVHFYANSEAKAQAAMIYDVSDLFARQVHLNVFTGAGIRVVNDVRYVDDLTQDGPAWRWPGFGYTSAPALANIGIFPGEKVFGEKRGG